MRVERETESSAATFYVAKRKTHALVLAGPLGCKGNAGPHCAILWLLLVRSTLELQLLLSLAGFIVNAFELARVFELVKLAVVEGTQVEADVLLYFVGAGRLAEVQLLEAVPAVVRLCVARVEVSFGVEGNLKVGSIDLEFGALGL